MTPVPALKRGSMLFLGLLLFCIGNASCQTPLVKRVDHIIFPMQGEPTLEEQNTTYMQYLKWGFPVASPGGVTQWPSTNQTFLHVFYQLGTAYGEMMVPRLFGIGLKSSVDYNTTQARLKEMGIPFLAYSTGTPGLGLIYLHVPTPGGSNFFEPPQMLLFFVFYNGADEDAMMRMNHRSMLLRSGTTTAVGAVLIQQVVLRASSKVYEGTQQLFSHLMGSNSSCGAACALYSGLGGGPDVQLVQEETTDEFLFRTQHVELAVVNLDTATRNVGSLQSGLSPKGCLIINNTALHQALPIHLCQLPLE